jgi:hypothetical protein
MNTIAKKGDTQTNTRANPANASKDLPRWNDNSLMNNKFNNKWQQKRSHELVIGSARTVFLIKIYNLAKLTSLL